MISVQQIQEVIAENLFGGDTTIAGLAMFAIVLALVFALFRNNYHVGIIVSIPLALMFSALGVLGSELMILLIVVAVLALALGAKKSLGE